MKPDAPSPRVLPPDNVEVRRFKTTTWHSYPTVTRDHFVNLPSREIPRSPYGGRSDRREPATGFFHTRKIDGAWTLVDPGGSPFISIGVNCVRSSEQEPDSRYAFQARFATRADWAAWACRLLREDLGFNSLGSWSDPEAFAALGTPIAYTLRLHVIGDFARQIGVYQPGDGGTHTKNRVLPVFHEAFPAHVDACVRGLAAHRDDPWVLGLFSDNEIPLYERRILARHLAMGEADPGCRRARAWMRQRGLAEADIRPDDDRDFCKHVLSTYFGLIRKAMDKHLPNHLYLGTRFHKAVNSQRSAYEALGEYADVISVNLYHRWTPDQRALTEWSEAAGKPLMITEWYAKGEDSGLRNLAGAGMTVHTQAERAKFYENFTLHLLRHPCVVGWHWFRWMDEPPLGHGADSANKGLLNAHYDPYAELAGAMRRINRPAYALRDALLGFTHPNLPDTAPVIQDPQFDEVETERTDEQSET